MSPAADRDKLRRELEAIRSDYEIRRPEAEGTANVEDTVRLTNRIATSGENPSHIGRYGIKNLLGEGGFGRVYLAHDEQLDRLVAVKVPHATMISQPEHVAAYLAEARTVANLDHGSIVPVYDVGSSGDHPLFAEMIKSKSWTPATLKEVGGTKGVGVTFLEETFSASTAPPERRYHQKAARAVLEDLLPDSGADIKGYMRSHAKLLEASGYGSRRQEFDDLIRILDGEIRLITPTDPEGVESDGDSVSHAQAGQKYFQLTHDYLVHSLRGVIGTVLAAVALFLGWTILERVVEQQKATYWSSLFWSLTKWVCSQRSSTPCGLMPRPPGCD